MTASLVAHIGSWCLLPPSIEVCALLAKRLSTGSRTQIFPFDVISGIAVCVVVMNILFDRVPR